MAGPPVCSARWYTRSSPATGRWLNSHTTSRPPGRVTRSISARAWPGSAVFRSPNEIVTASNCASANGSARASPATNVTFSTALRCLPAWSMPSEKSQATQVAPDAVKDTDDVPVPAARSSTRSPGPAATIRATARRQYRSWPADRTSLSRSYRPARPSNMAATSPGRLSSWARVIPPSLARPGRWLVPGRAGSQQAGPLPGLAEHVLGQEGQHGLVPDHGVAGVEDPVVLVREVQELGVLDTPGQVGPQPQ